MTDERKFKLRDRVTKLKGSSWTGRVVGFYSTSLTPVGYAVESENEPGSVQIYPEAALVGLASEIELESGLDALIQEPQGEASAFDGDEVLVGPQYDAPEPAELEKLPRYRIERPDEPHLIARHVLDDAGQWTRYDAVLSLITALRAERERLERERDKLRVLIALALEELDALDAKTIPTQIRAALKGSDNPVQGSGEGGRVGWRS